MKVKVYKTFFYWSTDCSESKYLSELTTTSAGFIAIRKFWKSWNCNRSILEETHGNIMDMLLSVMEIRGFLENYVVIAELEIRRK